MPGVVVSAGEQARRFNAEHLADQIDAAIRPEKFDGGADGPLGLNPAPAVILPSEFGISECRPDFFRRGVDVRDVNEFWFFHDSGSFRFFRFARAVVLNR